MSERRPLVVGKGEHLADVLLHHARSDGPTTEARDLALTRIVSAGAATGVGVLAASLANKGATASMAKVSTIVVAKWVVIGATAATAVLGAREAAERLTVSSDPKAESAVTREDRARGGRAARTIQEVARAVPDLTEPSAPADKPSSVETIAPPGANQQPLASQPELPAVHRVMPAEVAERSKDVAPTGATERQDPDVASPQLARELDLLEKTRVYLARRSAWAALDTLETYGAAFPAGTMKTEAAALRVEALAAVGRRQEAVASGREFLAAYPQNPLAERVRGILAKLEESPPRR
jgi:hypothetical protein